MGAGLALAEGEDPPSKVAQRLGKQLVRVPSNDRRTEILDEMIVLAKGDNDAAFVLRDALIKVWDRANKRLSAKQPLRPFGKLLEARKELDELRASTLAIIRDIERYPYPCKPPEATPEAAAAYKVAQVKIDASVGRMRELWRNGPEVRMPDTMLEYLELGHWAVHAKKRVGKEVGLSFKYPFPRTPPWVFGLPLGGEMDKGLVHLPTFGLSLAEQDVLRKNRAIRALNLQQKEKALEAAENRFERDRIRDEFRQVAHTNEYRELFGLHPLAWSDRLFRAARQHADFLWESGEFTHFQPEPEFHTFSDRARRAGYTKLVYENCHRGSNDPFDAHDALCHSSEHHRTILRENVQEMATARSGLAWVQNYGLDTGFQSGIQWGAWRD